MLKKIVITGVVTLLAAQTAVAQPADTSYKRARKNRDLTLRNCALIAGVKRVAIGQMRKVKLSSRLNREDYSLPQRYRFYACATDELGQATLYAKAQRDSTPVTFTFTADNFPKRQGVSCRSWPGSFIYKTVGSNHFTDVRRNTIGLILKYGAPGPYPSCVEAKDTQGNVVAKLGLYARGAGWAARYYAGVGCGGGTPFNGSAIASRARKNTGSSQIIMNFGNVCYGPIEANRCIGSAQC